MKKLRLRQFIVAIIFLGVILGVTLLLTCKASAASPYVKDINQAQFKESVGDYYRGLSAFKSVSKKPVVIDLYATWCGPCKRLSPILDELATEYKGAVDFYKIDIDKNPQIASAFGVQSIPMVIFIPVNGEPQVMVGLAPKSEIQQKINTTFFSR